MIEGLLVKLFMILMVMGTADLAFLIWLNFKKAKNDSREDKMGALKIKEIKDAERYGRKEKGEDDAKLPAAFVAERKPLA